MSSIDGLSGTGISLVSSNVIQWNNTATTAAGTSFGFKTTPGPPGFINPKLYFRFVKSKLHKIERDNLKKKLAKLQEIVNNAKELGQQAFYEKLMETIAITVRELEVSAVGCDRWVPQEVIDRFHKVYKPEGNKIVFFEPWEKFPRSPPPEVQEKIKRIRDLKLFDEYFVLYLDYTKEPLKTNKEKIREKDPILFGRFSYAPNRYYFIVDWVDEYCDLTFDKFIETMRAENPIDQKLPDLTSEYFDNVKKEVMERHERLKDSNANNFRQNMAVEDEKNKETKPKKPWWKFWE